MNHEELTAELKRQICELTEIQKIAVLALMSSNCDVQLQHIEKSEGRAAIAAMLRCREGLNKAAQNPKTVESAIIFLQRCMELN